MSEFRDILRTISDGQTWTERLYYTSPLAYALLKGMRAFARRSASKAAFANRRISNDISVMNATALASLKATGDVKISGGPFEGMRYLTQSTGSLLGPKIAGTYESEIAGWFDRAGLGSYDRLIDIGAAEGYYAVGIAFVSSRVEVHAYDVDPASRSLVRQLAELNGVGDRVQVDGLCDRVTLRDLLAKPGRSLLVLDIEGGEYDLLDQNAVPELSHTDIIVELHEHARPGVTWRLLERFAYTHAVDIVCADPDGAKVENAVNRGMTPEQASLSVREHRRLPQLWLRLRPR